MIDAIIMAISTARDHPYTRIVTSDAGSELLARVPGSDQSLLDAMGEMRSEEHTSELQSLMRISYAVFCLKKKKKKDTHRNKKHTSKNKSVKRIQNDRISLKQKNINTSHYYSYSYTNK